MRNLVYIYALILILTLTSGCSRFFGPEDVPTEPPTPTGVAVPTFTPTPESAAVPTASEATAAVAVAEATQAEATQAETRQAPVTLATVMAAATDTEISTSTVSITPTLVPTTTNGGDAAASANEPYVVIAAEIINVRSGPGTEYDIIGSVTAGQQLPTSGRNEGGDWWQVCCFESEQPGWLYGALLDVQNGERVAVAVDIPPAPTPAPTTQEPTTQEPALEPTAEPTSAAVAVADEPVAEATTPPAADVQPAAYSETAGNFDPNAQFQIVYYHVRGYDENNGGIFNNGGQHMIFITVLDENGAGIDGAVVKDALADDVNLVTGNKGPGKTEFEMFWEPYKLYVASIPSGPVTSQVSNQMNTAKPHIPDIVGKLGPPENEYAICPTIDDRCEPPFFHAHWSYEITFQKVK